MAEKVNWFVIASYFFWDTWTSSQVSNCGGVVLEICLDHKFQWPQEGLNYKYGLMV